jgi:hypothetical protein
MRFITLFIMLLSCFTAQAQFEENFRPRVEGDPVTVAEYMQEGGVTAFSFYADFGNGCDTSALLGHQGDEAQTALSLDTRFQAGSMGGAAVCLAILNLAHQGHIDLDAPANNYLETPLVDKRRNPDGPVTVRDLIIYKRDFRVNQKPKGYPFGESLPSMEQILAGSGPCNTPAIEVKRNINTNGDSQFANTLLLQLILEKHYSKPFQDIMQEHIFEPLGMNQTFYALELTEEQMASTCTGHDDQGKPIPGGYYRYPEQGASGLWTTPRDYCKLVRHVMDAAQGKDNRLISKEMAQAGMTRQFAHRSLIFHINDYGDIYWGGNGKGYYMYMQAWPEMGLITVAACNKDLQWRLVNPATWQTYEYVKNQ